jgi:hypothetical protein
MGVFRGAMTNLTSRHFATLDLRTTVFQRQNVRLTRTVGDPPPDAFDLRIVFDTPYRYDRNSGQLALQFGGMQFLRGVGITLDGEGISRERGWIYYSDFPNPPLGVNGMIVTKFSYTVPQ